MNLVRAGHLHTPVATGSLMAEAGDCSTATVAWVNEDGTVNLSVLDHGGVRGHSFTYVKVAEPKSSDPADEEEDEGRTFHLSGDCPWKR